MKRRSINLILFGFGAGLGLMYLFDPGAGRRRRRILRDKGLHMGRVAGHSLEKLAVDLRNRTKGMLAEMEHWVTQDNVSEEVLTERVRAILGRKVARPSAVEVTAEGGVITLSGRVGSPEIRGLLRAVGQVRGVQKVQNRLSLYGTLRQVPGLTPQSESENLEVH